MTREPTLTWLHCGGMQFTNFEILAVQCFQATLTMPFRMATLALSRSRGATVTAKPSRVLPLQSPTDECVHECIERPTCTTQRYNPTTAEAVTGQHWLTLGHASASQSVPEVSDIWARVLLGNLALLATTYKSGVTICSNEQFW